MSQKVLFHWTRKHSIIVPYTVFTVYVAKHCVAGSRILHLFVIGIVSLLQQQEHSRGAKSIVPLDEEAQYYCTIYCIYSICSKVLRSLEQYIVLICKKHCFTTVGAEYSRGAKVLCQRAKENMYSSQHIYTVCNKVLCHWEQDSQALPHTTVCNKALYHSEQCCHTYVANRNVCHQEPYTVCITVLQKVLCHWMHDNLVLPYVICNQRLCRREDSTVLPVQQWSVATYITNQVFCLWEEDSAACHINNNVFCSSEPGSSELCCHIL